MLDSIHTFAWCISDTISVTLKIIWYDTFVSKGNKNREKCNFHPRTYTCAPYTGIGIGDIFFVHGIRDIVPNKYRFGIRDIVPVSLLGIMSLIPN